MPELSLLLRGQCRKAVEQRRNICNECADAVDDCPGDPDAFEPVPRLIDFVLVIGKLCADHRNSGHQPCQNRADTDNFPVNIYDNVIGYCPHIIHGKGADDHHGHMLTINALTAADSVIIPVQAQYLPAKGLEQLLRTITRVKRQLNPKLEVDGIVLTMVDSRTTLAREINALVRKTYGGHVFASEIPRSIKAAEISVENKSIYDHDRSGKAALAYENLTREVLSLGKQIKRHRTDPVR